MQRVVRGAAIAMGACAVAAPVANAGASEPPLTVGSAKLAAALTCHGRIAADAPAPIVFAPGTGSDGSQVYLLGAGAFKALGHPVCVVSFPKRGTADVQVSVQYLVHAIRAVSAGAKRPVSVAGVSQGGLLARIALTYWPSLRKRVTDVVAAAAPFHGTPVPVAVCARAGCPPAIWQQARGSHLLRALNDGRDETPGYVSWTTVRSTTDEFVKPQTGRHPTSALDGAENIALQRICPGRRTSHLGTAVDSVTIAAVGDAIRHAGPAKVARLPADVCAHPFGTGLDETRTAQFLALAPSLIGQGLAAVPRVSREPRVRAWVEHHTPS
jgi:triacylglycerol esterase/lipase EstA (alpha/beta hydrolase family)